MCTFNKNFEETWSYVLEKYSNFSLPKKVNIFSSLLLRSDEKLPELTCKTSAYISMEFLMGRAAINNLINTNMYDAVKEFLESKNIDINVLDEVPEQNLGNGGLGRLASCFLESAATCNLPVVGYGLRFREGFFRQVINEDGQLEIADFWLDDDFDPWSKRVEEDKVLVEFSDGSKVYAVPYDIKIFGYNTDNIVRLRTWQAEPICDITKSLYPSDEYYEGKVLRAKQEYFLSFATISDLIRRFELIEGYDYSKFHKFFAVQLNDTHPVFAIPILINILTKDKNMDIDECLKVVSKVFSYTNHTILSEALEKWDGHVIRNVSKDTFDVIDVLNRKFIDDMRSKGYSYEDIRAYQYIVDDVVFMARIAISISHKVNGVSKLHTNILKDSECKEWFDLYPQKFINVTNGITPRRWLFLANKPLTDFISKTLESNSWMSNIDELCLLKDYVDDDDVISDFIEAKFKAKQELCKYIRERENVELDPDSLFMVQVKRIHEYKRQLLNLLGIYDYYIRLKTGELDINRVPKVVDIMGGKAAPSYRRAKNIIRFAKKLQNLINNDPDTSSKYKFVFITNFDVSYGEKIYPATDISKQISTAGKEASGTGNMKFMINGAVTLGTFDGANIEIFEEAGLRNNYAFGSVAKELAHARRDGYNPFFIYKNYINQRLKRAIDFLIEDRDYGFKELYDSLLFGGYGESPDDYFVIKDFFDYVNTQDKAILESLDSVSFYRKGFFNLASSSNFSSDRAIKEYAFKIWGLKVLD